jgi:hypothetical protein
VTPARAFVLCGALFGLRAQSIETGTIGGAIPPGIVAPTSALWFDAEAGAGGSCRLESTERWRCTGIPEPARGLVLLVSDTVVAALPVGIGASGMSIKRFGRLFVIPPGTVAPADNGAVQLTPWRPERSSIRTKVNRFVPIKDEGVDVLRVSPGTFWIGADSVDPESYLAGDGPRTVSGPIALTTLLTGPPDVPVYLTTLSTPWTLSGDVRTADGLPVEDAYVELFQALPPGPDAEPVAFEARSMVRVAETRSQADGRFAFDRLPPPPLLAAVRHSTEGRGVAVVSGAVDAVTIRLAAPARVTGRVLRRGLPVRAARVRFVPSASALIDSADPRELLADERTTAGDGRFALQLPPSHAGEIQIVAPDGVSVRLPLPSIGIAQEVGLGDINLTEPRRLTVRLLEPISCTLSAVGPLGGLGLTIVEATAAGHLHWFELPEPGRWTIAASCAGKAFGLVPSTVDVAPSGAEPQLNVRFQR